MNDEQRPVHSHPSPQIIAPLTPSEQVDELVNGRYVAADLEDLDTQTFSEPLEFGIVCLAAAVVVVGWAGAVER